MSKANFSMISLGCARSLVDSEAMVDNLRKIGFTLVPEGARDNITVLNTCSFIQSAIDETESNINELLNRKAEGMIKYVVVSGCYPSRFKRQELIDKFPDVDLWFTTQEEHQLHVKLAELVFKKRFNPTVSKPYVKLTPSHFAYVKISEGCNNWCSFCTIPKIRGEHTSRPIPQILDEIKKQLDMGAKEIILIAEDTTCWGEDLFGKPSFPMLLKEIAKLPIPWVRCLYVYPNRMTDELLETFAAHPNILPYIDMPLQHISSPILKDMNRKIDRPFVEETLQRLYASIPNLALRTTFILGFPGETEEHVEELCEFIKKHPFEHLGCFTYSFEKETKSARLPNHVPLDEAHRRVSRVMEVQYDLVTERNKARIGQQIQVLFEGNRMARSYREAPDVDSVIVLDNDEGLKAGSFYTATFTGTSGYDLLAKI
jgi:ribosomal protein S12 methylthiotransferase